MPAAFQAEFADKGILKIVFDYQERSVNLLNEATLTELDGLITELADSAEIRAAYVVSGKADNFCAGAEVAEIRKISSQEDAFKKSRIGQQLFQRWSQLPFPTLLVIDGSCMGGATEWALASTFRFCGDRREVGIGLPEIKLGVIPGWGGSVRLPNLIGLRNALKMILTGDAVTGPKAYRMGLVDKLVPASILDDSALRFLRDILENGDKKVLQRRRQVRGRRGFLETSIIGRNLVQRRAYKEVSKRTRLEYPAPFEAIKTVKFGRENDLEDALMYEARKFAVLAASKVSRNLVRTWFLIDRSRKMRGVGNEVREAAKTPIEKVGIFGAGTVGGAIAVMCGEADIPVRLKDVQHDPLAKTIERARDRFQERIAGRKLSEREAELKADRISPTTDDSGFSRVDLLIEATQEDAGIKEDALHSGDRLTPEKTIVATTSSTYGVDALARHVRQPHLFAGIHLPTPVNNNPIVEIVKGVNTSPQTLATLFQLALNWKKFPIVVKDKPGYLVNRLLMPYLSEAMTILSSGVQVEHIDLAMQQFGFEQGPLRFLDEMGLDIAMRIFNAVQKEYPARFPENETLFAMLNYQRAGRKSGKGFYEYHPYKKPAVRRKLYKELQIKSNKHMPVLEIQERLLYVMINEAAYCLQEGIVPHSEDVDLASIFSIGFPPFHGGLLGYADSEGIEKIAGRLRIFAESLDERQRYLPSPYLIRMVESGKLFYSRQMPQPSEVPQNL